MAFPIPKIPVILTDADWQKKKGLKAKISGGTTGLGDLMKKIETADNAVDWRQFEIGYRLPQLKSDWSTKVIATQFEVAKAQMTKVKALASFAKQLEAAAKKTEEDWQKNDKIPPDSKKHVKEVHQAAKTYAALVSEEQVKKALEEEKAACELNYATYKKEMSKQNDKLRLAINGFEAAAKNATLKSYPEFWKQNIRYPGTILPFISDEDPKIEKIWEVWKHFSNSLKQPKDETELQTTLNTLTKAALFLKPLIAHI